MYLSDRDIRALLPMLQIEGPVDHLPFEPDEQIQPCSIDLRVSNVFWKPSRRRRWIRRLLPGQNVIVDLRRSHIHNLDPRRDWRRLELGEGETLTIKPGHVLMGRIYERLQVPEDYAGKVEGRSSFARLGLQVHTTGDFINPGWGGFMPLQLYNAGPYPVRLTPFLSICQLMLVKVSGTPERSYGDDELQSKYQNDDGGPSFWWRDRQIKRLQERLGEVHVSERIQLEIVERVRWESPDVLERFQNFVQSQKIKDVENADDLLRAFAKVEDRRRIADIVALASPAVAIGGIYNAAFAEFGVATVVAVVLALVTGLWALFAFLRRDAGYLGAAAVRKLAERPADAS